MFEKYIRNIEMEEVEERYRERRHEACGRRCPPTQYPMRPAGKYQIVPIGGFIQHPNESQHM